MKLFLKKLILKHGASLGLNSLNDFEVEIPKVPSHGDYSTNVAMQVARATKQSPRILAQSLVESLKQESDYLSRVEIAGPGFINFFINPTGYHIALKALESANGINLPNLGQGKSVLIEFVSANPTGPMHIGHGRNAVVGDVLARVFAAMRYRVQREFYINDHGAQIQTLGKSGAHYLARLQGKTLDNNLPTDVYQGEYLETLVKKYQLELEKLNDDQAMGKLLSKDLLAAIQQTLAKLRVHFDDYFSESKLYESKAIDQVLKLLKEKGFLYESEGALWFRSTDLGDDKDRVLVKKDGTYTYLTPDIAYHKDKFDRHYDLYINVLGADHGGYLERVRASLQALGYDPNQLKFLLMQLVNLMEGDVQKKMSKRKGTVVTLEEVLTEVGVDATRFFLVMRSHHQTLDFDLELAKQQSSENPVYYVQYAYARLFSILNKASESGLSLNPTPPPLGALNLPEEMELIQKMLSLEDILQEVVANLEPHRVTFYLMDLAKSFQAYYTKGKSDARYRVLGQASEVSLAKLYLVKVLRDTFKQGLDLLGVSAPERM
ncbi:MAG: arginine--tRNA ligase [Deltaproteobacteria bacterium]|nr:arginine--tRNA ligase [Deltaproteobacteria bacterium]